MLRLFVITLLLLIASSTALTVAGTKEASGINVNKGRPKAMGLRMPGRMPAVVAKTSNACCPDYPYCGCPKLETAAANKIHRIKLPSVAKQNQGSSDFCCSDYPYCGCPKLEASNYHHHQYKTYQIDLAKQISNSCCSDYPYCGCPKLEADTTTTTVAPRFETIKVGAVSVRRSGVMALRATRQQ